MKLSQIKAVSTSPQFLILAILFIPSAFISTYLTAQFTYSLAQNQDSIPPTLYALLGITLDLIKTILPIVTVTIVSLRVRAINKFLTLSLITTSYLASYLAITIPAENQAAILNQQNQAIQSQYQQTLSTHKAKQAEVESNINSINSQIETLNSQMQTINVTINSYIEREYLSKANSLNSQVTELTAKIANLQQTLSSLKAKQVSLESSTPQQPTVTNKNFLQEHSTPIALLFALLVELATYTLAINLAQTLNANTNTNTNTNTNKENRPDELSTQVPQDFDIDIKPSLPLFTPVASGQDTFVSNLPQTQTIITQCPNCGKTKSIKKNTNKPNTQPSNIIVLPNKATQSKSSVTLTATGIIYSTSHTLSSQFLQANQKSQIDSVYKSIKNQSQSHYDKAVAFLKAINESQIHIDTDSLHNMTKDKYSYIIAFINNSATDNTTMQA